MSGAAIGKQGMRGGSMSGNSEIAARYRIRADVFQRKIEGVRPEQWSNPSPCAKWTARDLVPADGSVSLDQDARITRGNDQIGDARTARWIVQ